MKKSVIETACSKLLQFSDISIFPHQCLLDVRKHLLGGSLKATPDKNAPSLSQLRLHLKVDADSIFQAAQTLAVVSSVEVQSGLQKVDLWHGRLFLHAQVQKVLGCSVVTCRGILGLLSQLR